MAGNTSQRRLLSHRLVRDASVFLSRVRDALNPDANIAPTVTCLDCFQDVSLTPSPANKLGLRSFEVSTGMAPL